MQGVCCVLYWCIIQICNILVQVNQDGLKLRGTQQLLVYADGVNVLGGSIQTVKKNTEPLVAARKEFQLEVNVDKTKHMVMSGELNAG